MVSQLGYSEYFQGGSLAFAYMENKTAELIVPAEFWMLSKLILFIAKEIDVGLGG